MHSRSRPWARRTALAVGVATVTLMASFATVARAGDDPVADSSVEAGDDVAVAVGSPPVAPVGEPPPTSVVAVAAPPVAPPSVVAVAAPPVTPPAVAAAPRFPSVVSAPSVPPADVERIAEVIVDVAATVQAGLALIDSRL